MALARYLNDADDLCSIQDGSAHHLVDRLSHAAAERYSLEHAGMPRRVESIRKFSPAFPRGPRRKGRCAAQGDAANHGQFFRDQKRKALTFMTDRKNGHLVRV